MKSLCRLVVLLAFASQSQLADAQRPEPAGALWSFAAVPAGTRVRVIDIRGQRLEGRVAAVSDTVLWLRGGEATLGPPIRVRDIRTLDVHAAPASRYRTSLVSAGIGAVLGGLAGAAAHGDSGEGGPAGFGDPPGRAENITVGAVLGATVGWVVGRFALGRARWQRVALP